LRGVAVIAASLATGGGRNPHRSGEVFARGKLVRSVSMVQTEKPPPKWGGGCEAGSQDGEIKVL
jgi:hypothetical protein